MSSMRLRPILGRSSSNVKPFHLIVDATVAMLGIGSGSGSQDRMATSCGDSGADDSGVCATMSTQALGQLTPREMAEVVLPDFTETTRLQAQIFMRSRLDPDEIKGILTAVLGLAHETKEDLITSVPAANESSLGVVNIPAGSSAVLHAVMNALQLPFSLKHLETLATAFAKNREVQEALTKHCNVDEIPEIPPLLSGQNFPRESTRPLNLQTVAAFARCFRRRFAHFYLDMEGRVTCELLPKKSARLKSTRALGAILSDSNSERLRVLYIGGAPRVKQEVMLSDTVRDVLQARWREIFKMRERQAVELDDEPLDHWYVVSDEPPIRVSFPPLFLKELQRLCPSVVWSSPEPPERSEGNLQEDRTYLICEPGDRISADRISAVLEALKLEVSPVFMQQLFVAYQSNEEVRNLCHRHFPTHPYKHSPSEDGAVENLMSHFTDRAFVLIYFVGPGGAGFIDFGLRRGKSLGIVVHDMFQERWGYISAGKSTRMTPHFAYDRFQTKNLIGTILTDAFLRLPNPEDEEPSSSSIE